MLVGEALDDVKDEVVIATKFGVSINPDRSLNISSKPDEISEVCAHTRTGHRGEPDDLRECWWALQDLNLRPLPCQGSALPLS